MGIFVRQLTIIPPFAKPQPHIHLTAPSTRTSQVGGGAGAGLQGSIEQLRRDSGAAGGRLERLTQDINQLRREKQSVQHNYEQQVSSIAHHCYLFRISSLHSKATAAYELCQPGNIAHFAELKMRRCSLT